MNYFQTLIAALLLAVPTATLAQNAINIDENGDVTIPGKLSAGAVQAVNLDQTLADLKAQVEGLKSDIATLTQTLTQRAEAEKWFVYAPTVGAAMDKVTDTEVLKYEFGVVRNKGFRIAHFSDWNRGLRLTTEPYMTGDSPDGTSITAYRLGGSVWINGDAWTYDGMTISSNVIINYQSAKQFCGTSKVYHMYYKYTGGNVVPQAGNGCRDDGPVYARARAFK